MKLPLKNISSKATSGTDMLHHLAFDNTAQASIISMVKNGKIITANTAACKLLGYSIKEILTKKMSDIFDISQGSIKKMLKEKKAAGQLVTFGKVIKKNSKKLSCEITSAVFMDNDGIEKSIITLADKSLSILNQKEIDIKKEKIIVDDLVLAKLKQKNIDIKKEKIVAADIVIAKRKQKHIDNKKEKIVADDIKLALANSDARLADNNAWIKYIAKTSYDVMWDWDIATNKIYVGDSIEEVFGYKVEKNTVDFSDFIQCLLPEEKVALEKKISKTLESSDKSWDDSFMFMRQDGSVATVNSRASIVRDEKGNVIRLIGAIHDVSKLHELENKLEEQITIQKEDNEKFLITAKLSLDVIWDWSVLSDEVFTGEGFEELFGYDMPNNKGNISDWGTHLHPEDREAVEKDLQEAIASSSVLWEKSYRFLRADGYIGKIFNRASIFRNADKKAFRMIGVMQDISRQNENKKASVELIDNRKSMLIEKIKNVIIELVHYSDEQLQTNFSNYISNKLQYDYTYLANIFSEVEGTTIEKFIISHKIERAKELIVDDKLNLTEIASKLHYSSVAHLSNQFKKITGVTPSSFKELVQNRNSILQNV